MDFGLLCSGKVLATLTVARVLVMYEKKLSFEALILHECLASYHLLFVLLLLMFGTV